MYDVVIIGAGPAGSMAAYHLADAGFQVAVIDKAVFPRKKACAGGITPKALKLFPYDITPVVKQVCTQVKISAPDMEPFFIRQDHGLCSMVDRAELDAFCLDRARKKDAVLLTENVAAVIEHPDHVSVSFSDGTSVHALYLIGADGANSIVRRSLYGRGVVCRQFALEADLPVNTGNSMPMAFDFTYNKNGYFWIFPKQNHVNIGMFTTDSRERIRVERLRAFAQDKFGKEDLFHIKGYPICTHGNARHLGSRRMLLCGDAAGCAEPLLGEGIYFALKSATLAAGAIKQSQTRGLPADFSYRKAMQPVFYDLKLYALACRWFYHHRPLALRMLSLQGLHLPFAHGYAHGLTLSDILSFVPLKLWYKNKVSKM